MTNRRRGLASGLLALVTAVPLPTGAAPGPSLAVDTRDAAPLAAPGARAAPVDVSDRVIRKAIADSKDPMDDIVPVGRTSFGSGGSTASQRLDRRFQEAEIPTCLTPDAFRFAPPVVGFVGLSGVLALPFWLNAIASGKCRH